MLAFSISVDVSVEIDFKGYSMSVICAKLRIYDDYPKNHLYDAQKIEYTTIANDPYGFSGIGFC